MQSYDAFTVTHETYLEELNMKMTELVHEKSQAKVLHVACDDPENVFCLSFQTRPSSSNGVAHILEHMVLCGSQKYPVKDPFFAMTRRSLNTFMNALTGSDFTCYPAASQVEKDFYNLLDVYLDAVFYPKLQKESFLQEGWRLELEDMNDLQSPFIYQGIVLNEMKGAFTSSESRMWHALCKALLPDLTYAHISGGDPLVIPSLRYEDLVQFHETFYHPSRCLFFFYGNLPLEKHLTVLENSVLKNIEPARPLPPIAKQPLFSQPKLVTTFYPVQKNSQEACIITFGWLTVEATDQDTLFALFLLDAILMENDASPLKLALIQSGLCVTANSFFDPDMSQVPYGIMCKGCDATKAQELESFLFHTLQTIASENISEQLIESALYQLELSRTEIDGEQGPFGLTLFMRAALSLNHGGKPEKALQIHSIFHHLRNQIRDPYFLPSIITKYLLQNPHRVRLIQLPDPTLLDQEKDAEKQLLKQLKEQSTLEEVHRIIEQTESLQTFQEEQENQDISCLPQVTLNDVPILTEDLTLKKVGTNLVHSTFTNGLVYADLITPIPYLTEDQLFLVKLLISLLPELGNRDKSYVKQLEYIQAHVGQLQTHLSVYPHVLDPSILHPSIVLRSKSLEKKSEAMVDLMHNTLLYTRFDEKERIRELIEQIHLELQQKLTKNSLKYASMLATSTLSCAGYLTEKWHGLSYFQWLSNLVNHLPQQLDTVIFQLKEVYEKITTSYQPELILGYSPSYDLRDCQKDKTQLHKSPFKPWINPPLPSEQMSQARPVASTVGFNCQAFKVCSYSHPDAPYLALGAHIMEHLILHPKIREQNGAYGAYCSYTPSTGHFSFQTYRDPYLASSLIAFEKAIEVLANGQFVEADLDCAKLECIQSLDAPISPSSKALTAYNYMRQGKDLQTRQHYRNRLLNASLQDIALAVQNQLLPQIGKGITVSFGEKTWLEKENAILQNPLPIIPI